MINSLANYNTWCMVFVGSMTTFTLMILVNKLKNRSQLPIPSNDPPTIYPLSLLKPHPPTIVFNLIITRLTRDNRDRTPATEHHCSPGGLRAAWHDEEEMEVLLCNDDATLGRASLLNVNTESVVGIRYTRAGKDDGPGTEGHQVAPMNPSILLIIIPFFFQVYINYHITLLLAQFYEIVG